MMHEDGTDREPTCYKRRHAGLVALPRFTRGRAAVLQASDRMTRPKPIPPKNVPSDRPGLLKDRSKVMPLFLDKLRAGATPRRAAIEAGSALSTLRTWKVDDEEFSKLWDAAYDEGTDVLVEEAQRRAVEGYDEVTVTESDGPKGSSLTTTTARKYSDTLLNITLQARRPGEFGKSRVELTGKDGGPIQAVMEVEFIEPPAKVKK